ncbi:MAG TPA: hypothetical protein VFG92_09865 [Agromyces sp.]|nr:hypothetical protein [Agromyces sp.]
MARDEASPPEGNTFTRFFDRVERALLPALGPTPNPEEREDDATPVDQRPCPICGHPMFEHVVDHSTPNTVLVCPTDERLPEHDETTPLNELGMPLTEHRREKHEDRREHD